MQDQILLNAGPDIVKMLILLKIYLLLCCYTEVKIRIIILSSHFYVIKDFIVKNDLTMLNLTNF